MSCVSLLCLYLGFLLSSLSVIISSFLSSCVLVIILCSCLSFALSCPYGFIKDCSFEFIPIFLVPPSCVHLDRDQPDCYWKTYIFSSPVFLCTYPEQPVCTSLLFILLFIKSQYTVFCTSYCFALFIPLHILLLFLFFYHIYALVLCYFYITLIFYSFALSTERTWFDYISLLIIPCIIYYVTNKETLTLTEDQT